MEGDVPLPAVLRDDDPGRDVPAAVLGEVLAYGELSKVQRKLLVSELRIADQLGVGRVVDRVDHVLHYVRLVDAERRGDLLPGGEEVAYGPAPVEVGEKDGPVLILGYDLGRILTVCIDLLLDLVLGACEVLPNGHGWGSALFVIKYCWIRC